MAENDSSWLDRLASNFVPIHRDGQTFVALAAVVTLLMFLLWSPLGWIAAIATIWVAYVFRDPDRVVPLREGLVLAPADGKVEALEQLKPDSALGLGDAERIRVSIHLSMFDVHLTRAPAAGEVVAMLYSPGRFGSVSSDKASKDNERRAIVLGLNDDVQLGIVQIAGGIRRRVVSFVKENDRVGAGERIGLIRFGSRVDIYLPSGAVPLVALGQRMVAGETVIADLRSDEPERSTRVI